MRARIEERSFMLRSIVTLCAVILLTLGISCAQARENLSVKPGDLIVQHDKNGWAAIKILAVDPA